MYRFVIDFAMYTYHFYNSIREYLCVGLRNRPQEPLEMIKSPLSKKIRLESTDTPHPSCFAEEISDISSVLNQNCWGHILRLNVFPFIYMK